MCALLWQYANKSSGEVPFGTWTGKAATGILEQKEKENEKFPQKLTAVHPRHYKSPVQVCLNHSGDTLHILRLSERGSGVFWFEGWKNGCDVQFKLGAWREWNITVSHVGKILLLK